MRATLSTPKTTSSSKPTFKLAALVRGTIVLFVPLAALAALLMGWVYFVQYKAVRAHYMEIIQVQVEALRSAVDRELGRVLEDIRFIAEPSDLNSFLTDRSIQNRKSLIESWWELALQRKIYDQIRFINLQGMEVVRINYADGSVQSVPQSQLQLKADRYYVRETLALKSGEIFVSPFDLNKEHGTVERPYKPMIRVAAPVFDEAGIRQGIVVLNYLATRLLQELANHADSSDSGVVLLNRQGYYLRGFRPDQEWGFMFEGQGKLQTLANQFPDAWSVISQATTGQLDEDEGIFTFQHITFPANEAGNETGMQRTWILVNFLSAADLAPKLTPIKRTVLTIAGIMLVILLIASIVISRANLQRKSAREALLASENSNRLILEAVAEGIFGIDVDGRTTFANPAALKMLGYSKTELLNKPIHSLTHHSYPDGSTYPEHACRMLTAIPQGIPVHVNDEVFWRKNGTSFAVEYTSIPMLQNGSIHGAVITFRDITDRIKTEETLRKMAAMDYLTGIYNRKKLEELMEQEVKRSHRYGSPVSVAMFDLDHFKHINDTYGHQAGDKVLQEVVKVTQKNLRETDMLARWGGEEYMILAPETDLTGILRLAEKIRKTFAAHRFKGVGKVTASFGIAQYQSNESISRFLKRLDDALYQAKRAGRNCTRAPKTELKVVNK